MSNIQQQTIVIGLGKSGLSVVEFLLAQGESVVAMDTRDNPPFAEEVREEHPDVALHLGGLNADLLKQCKKIVLSPGLSLKTDEIQQAIKAGVSVVGDIQVFADYAKAPIVAITGSNAKSTVTTLVGEMAKDAGLNVAIGGNLGTPALELINDNVELYVMELSSFQLETTPNLNAKVATVLNISPDHLDRYDSYEEYWHAKHAIFNGCDVAVINRDDEKSSPIVDRGIGKIYFGLGAPDDNAFGVVEQNGKQFLAIDHQALLDCKDLKIKGSHNRSNAVAALALGKAAGLSLDSMITTLKDFPGLEHRCQWVGRHRGVDYFNDSKGTNVGATEAALEGLGPDMDGSIVLMAGGDGKGADFAFLKAAMKHVKTVVAYGRDKALIEAALSSQVDVIQAEDFQQAFDMANDRAKPGDAVLLSPACASFDMFKSFEHRGEVFISMVEAL
jgi:UDP-N-acetylmuramoylalanine--D-glutamate ligase